MTDVYYTIILLFLSYVDINSFSSSSPLWNQFVSVALLSSLQALYTQYTMSKNISDFQSKLLFLQEQNIGNTYDFRHK